MTKKVYDDDDGRAIADMSGLDFPGAFSFRGVRPKKPERGAEQSNLTDRPWEAQKDQFSRSERRMAILGALKAALLIGSAYIVGLGLLIWLMVAVLT